MADLQFCFRRFSKFYENQNFLETCPGSCELPQKLWTQSVLMFLGYKLTDRQTRQAKYIRWETAATTNFKVHKTWKLLKERSWIKFNEFEPRRWTTNYRFNLSYITELSTTGPNLSYITELSTTGPNLNHFTDSNLNQ